MSHFITDFETYKEEMLSQNNDLAKSIMSENKVIASSLNSYSFICSVLKILHPDISSEKFKDFIIDDSGDEQLDVIVIQGKNIFIYDFKTSAGFGESDIRLFKDSVEKYIFSTKILPVGSPNNFKNLVGRTREILNDYDDPSIHIRIIRGGRNIENAQNIEILEALDSDFIKEITFWSMNEIIAKELNLKSSPLKTNFKFKIHYNNQQNEKSSIIIKSDKNIESIICRIKLKELIELYQNHQPTPERLFISNVRSYQNNKKLGDGIIESLSNIPKAKEFYKKHNGIAIVCDEIKKNTNFNYTAVNPQIINGCQTITTISNKFQKDFNKNKVLEYATVITKIFKAEPSQVESICFASNRQVQIQDSDLRTNDNIQIILESFLKKVGFRYDRKVNKAKKAYDITFTEIGQYLVSGMLHKPHVSKNEKALIYSLGTKSYYNIIFREDINLKEVKNKIALAIWLKKKIQLDKNLNKVYFIANFQIHSLLCSINLNENQWEEYYVLAKKTINDFILLKEIDPKNFVNIFAKKEITFTQLLEIFKHNILLNLLINLSKIQN